MSAQTVLQAAFLFLLKTKSMVSKWSAAVLSFDRYTDLLYEGLNLPSRQTLNASLLPDTAIVSLIQAMEKIQSL